MRKKAQPTKPIETDALGDEVKILPASNIRYGEPQAIAEFREQAEKHFNGPVFITNVGGELTAYATGKQAAAPQPAAPVEKPAKQPAEQAEGIYLPGISHRLKAYKDFYLYDVQHRTSELARYRAYVRETKRQALYARHGVTE